MSLSPFDIKGKGWIKINTLSPFSLHVEEAFCRSDVYWGDQAPPEFMLNLQNIFSNEVHDSMTFLSSMTHIYIKDPSKWIYTFQLSYPTKWVYKIRLSYPTKWVYKFQLSYPTKWVYKIRLSYPTKWVYKFDKSLHDWILQFYIMGLNKTFSSNYTYDHL